MKKYFAYYNQYKNGIDIAFDDNVLLFLSCAEAEKNIHTTPNSQRLIDNLAIDEPLKYAALALDCELQAWTDAMDEDWSPQSKTSLTISLRNIFQRIPSTYQLLFVFSKPYLSLSKILKLEVIFYQYLFLWFLSHHL